MQASLSTPCCHAYLSSVGYSILNHSCQPPFNADTLVNPMALSLRPTRELVYSLGQAQYSTMSCWGVYFLAQASILSGSSRTAPLIFF